MAKIATLSFFLVAVSTVLSAWHWETIGAYVRVVDGNKGPTATLNKHELNTTTSVTTNTTLQSPLKASNWTSFHLTNTTLSTNEPAKRMDIQLAITGSIKLHENAMRLLTTSVNGWHRDFEDVQIYTFDEIHPNSPFYKVITPVHKLFPKEKTKRNNNLLLAAIEGVYKHNPNADWYFLAEDDSIIIKENLMFAIRKRKLNSTKYIMAGKSVHYQQNKGENLPRNLIPFVVGGSGILLSHALTQKLAPLIPTCRRKYNKMAFGDARIGACIEFELKLHNVQPIELANLFTNGDPKKWIAERGKDPKERNRRPIGLHEKDPARIQLLQDWIFEQRAKKQKLSWKAMRDSGLWGALNNTKTPPRNTKSSASKLK